MTKSKSQKKDKELEELLKKAQEEAAKKDAKDDKKTKGKTADEKTPAEVIQELEEKIQRVNAELVNAKNRMQREKEDFMKYATQNTISSFIPVLDTFELALAHTPENLKKDHWVVGMNHVKTQFVTVLESLGVTKIPTKGQKMDSHLHEAVEMVPGEKELVVEEVSAGYTLNGRVIRAAKVKVGNGEKA